MVHRTTVAPSESSVITERSMTWEPAETARSAVIEECINAIRDHYGFSDDEKKVAVAVLNALKPSMALPAPPNGET